MLLAEFQLFEMVNLTSVANAVAAAAGVLGLQGCTLFGAFFIVRLGVAWVRAGVSPADEKERKRLRRQGARLQREYESAKDNDRRERQAKQFISRW